MIGYEDKGELVSMSIDCTAVDTSRIDTLLIDFQGGSTIRNAGLGDVGISEILHNDKGLIGSMWIVDFSPFPASFTFVRGYTNIFGVSNI